MRLRNIPGSRETIAENDFVIQNPTQYKGLWKQQVFQNNNLLHIEIGMGKGQFLSELAKRHKDINFLGIEKYSSVLLRALEKRETLELTNLYYLRFDAEKITELFDQGEIDKIYLNFSDPWPKDRHAKRRLTSCEFLSKYHLFLKKEGKLAFKTDNRSLFDFSIEEAKINNWELQLVTYDLHNSPYCEGNIMTEYEERFSSMGNPICHFISSAPSSQ